MAQEAELQYEAAKWDDELLRPAGKVPSGLLYKVKCSEDAALCQLHLPHCEPKTALRLDQLLSVAAMTDDGMSILEALEITDTHVVVKVPHLAAFGLIWDVVRRFLRTTQPVKGKVLLYLRRVGPKARILDVFLVQDNIPLHQVSLQQQGEKFIKAPTDCLLNFGQTYRVHSEPGGFHIQPDKEVFYLKHGPNWHPTYEIFVKNVIQELTVIVEDAEKKEVWRQHVSLNDAVDVDPNVTVPADGSGPAADDPNPKEKKQEA